MNCEGIVFCGWDGNKQLTTMYPLEIDRRFYFGDRKIVLPKD